MQRRLLAATKLLGEALKHRLLAASRLSAEVTRRSQPTGATDLQSFYKTQTIKKHSAGLASLIRSIRQSEGYLVFITG